MAGNFEIDEHGALEAEIGIRGHLGYKDRVQHLVNRAARSAEIHMKLHVPHGPLTKSTGGMRRAIGRQDTRFRPGGAGGGGTWVAIVGVERTPETTTDGFSYPSNVFHGTGLYGPHGRAIKTAPGNVMKIEGYKARDIDRGTGKVLGGRTGRLHARPGVIWTHQVMGQRPQQAWFHDGVDRAQLVIASNLHRVFHLGDRLDDI